MEYNFKELSFEELKKLEKEYDEKVKSLVILIENPHLIKDIETLEFIRKEIQNRKENG